ncbi:Hypothetical protein EHI5A_087620 [Entamoeba histolytica KU27]|uniref:Uncharacterized protein n=1 Tax=Entamoeba histolytica KU27 TaxID=885311 RepID=M2QC86_ENTHI|nr:Hypothetical protein EHI5A_087620 [Entamoeba histolytica KU27]
MTENKERILRSEFWIQIYYLIITFGVIITPFVGFIFKKVKFGNDLLTNHVFIVVMSFINFVIGLPVLFTRVLVKYVNNYKEPMVTQIASYFGKFSLNIITNICILFILYYFSFHGMYILLTIINCCYYFITNIILIHIVLPQQSNQQLENEEIKSMIEETCKEYHISLKNIYVNDYMAISFCGIEEQKTLLIGKQFIEHCSKEEIKSYIIFNINNNFDKSVKYTLIESINVFCFYYLIEYLYFNSNQFYSIDNQYICIGMFLVLYFYENLSYFFTMTINSIEYYFNISQLNNIHPSQLSYFKSSILHLLQSLYFYGDELKKLHHLEKQQRLIEQTRELKYMNPLYREGDDDDEGHDDDCECEQCEFKRRVVVQRQLLPNKDKANIEDLCNDFLSLIENSPNPSLFHLLSTLRLNEKKSI